QSPAYQEFADLALKLNRPQAAIPFLEETLQLQPLGKQSLIGDRSVLKQRLIKLYKATGRDQDADRLEQSST
ncbi:MAG: hypothetical protein ACKO85_20825, partial [Isosphaeraceae bacterium]